jgi:cytochrome P450
LDHVSDIADMMFQVPLELNPSRNARFRSALAAAHEIIHRKVNRRRAMANPPRDLLTLLLQAERLSEQQVMDEVVTMIVAGHESTAIPLTWVWRLFMRNPAAAERMNAELEQILQNRLPSAEDLPNLPYTKMVLEETLRLCPPISVTARQATVAETVGGVSIPAKGTVVVSAYTTHRHPDFWEDAEKFEPERFSTERSVNRHRYAYFPFYGGRHQCIGQPLAMLEGHLILATVASHCHLHPLPEHRYAPRPGIALRNPDGFPAHVEFRRPVLSD